MLEGTTNSSSITNPDSTESSRLNEASAKRQRQLPTDKIKSFGMSASYHLNERVASKQSINPLNSPPNHTSAIVSEEVAVVYAMKIQKWIKHKDAIRAARNFKNTFYNQSYRLPSPVSNQASCE
jgi:hypothetical protein